MENEKQDEKQIEVKNIQPIELSKKDYTFSISIVVSALILAGAWIYTAGLKINDKQKLNNTVNLQSALEEQVLPSNGVVLPIRWNDLGLQLVNAGVIDTDKLKNIYEQRGVFTEENKKLLFEKNNGNIKITANNAGYLLNLFWALGLANKNSILESGEMTNPAYGGAGNFASTGGWTIAQGKSMDHYSRHIFFHLTSQQQALVEKISKGIYRPCCNNSTYFPDCNHGMAMLGLLELMASQGVSEQDMWKIALIVNSYWFPDTYITIATYMQGRGVEWKDVNPQEMLGVNYSSAQGYAKIVAQVSNPQQQRNGSGCEVDSEKTIVPQGCGI